MSMQPFDPAGPLRRGITLLEASAGTGKTYTISHLVLRLVADEGIEIGRIAVVTFTRAATAELKGRLWQRLEAGRQALAGGTADPTLQSWADTVRAAGRGPEAERRLGAALRDFDQALVSTIHGFCQRLLQEHAFAAGVDLARELSTDTSAMLEHIVDDLWTRRTYDRAEEEVEWLRAGCGFDRADLLKLARAVTDDPDLWVLPDGGPGVAEWPPLVARFRAAWRDRLGPALVEAIDSAHQAGRFKPRQRTYNRKKAEEAVAEVDRWLAEHAEWPLLGTPPGPVRALAAEQIADRLADPDDVFEHEALTALADLLVAPARMAAVEAAQFAWAVRQAYEAHKAEAGVWSYADLLRTLAMALADPVRGPAVVAAVRSRLRVALIDEFQDTDALQWRIFGELFGRPDRHLFVIGDPKQAIYAFRGANVHVYLQAAKQARHGFTLATNHRSDAACVAAMNALMHRAGFFGGAEIDYRPVGSRHADRVEWPADASPGERAPVQVRWFDGGLLDPALSGTPLKNEHTTRALAARTAADVVDFLRRGVTLVHRGGAAASPRDCAVLVRSHDQAAAVVEALRARDVPAVVSRTASVYQSPEADLVQCWLAALDQPRDAAARNLAAVGPFGWSGPDLQALRAGDPAATRRWEGWLQTLDVWRRLYEGHGVMRALRALLEHRPDGAETFRARLLGEVGGERRLTDLLHLGELLHAAEQAERLRLSALIAWYARQRAQASGDDEAQQIRLERDDDAVQVVTVHASKGLQYPFVWIPYAWRGAALRREDVARTRVPRAGDPTTRELDLRPKSDKADALRRAEQEQRQEDLRLLYVALTRAEHRCVIYFGPVAARDWTVGGSPLAMLLYGPPPAGPAVSPEALEARLEDLGPAALRHDLDALAREGLVAVSDCEPPDERRWAPPRAEVAALATATWDRPPFDLDARRWSFTALVHGAEAAGEDDVSDPVEGADAATAPRPAEDDVPLAAFPAGEAAGRCLHELLEHYPLERAAGEGTPAGLVEAAATHLERYGLPLDQAGLVADGITRALRTPLGPAVGDLRLCDVDARARLPELRFHHPIAGAPLSRVRAALRRRVPDETLTAAYLDTLETLTAPTLRGWMTGSIDLLFRSPRDGRWYLADYKCHRLDPERSGRCRPGDYAFPVLRRTMESAHYYLQYHLYLVALHRYLGLRLGEHYDYDRHVGGALYLFVRGMLGPDTQRAGDRVHGVFFDRPPGAVIEALSACFGEVEAA